MLKYVLSIFKVLLVAIGFSLIAAVPNAVSEERDKNLLIVGLELPPYIVKNEGAPPSGILIEKLRKLCDAIGLTPEFRISNWARSIVAIKEGLADAIIPAMKSEDRKQFLHFPTHSLGKFEIVLAGPAEGTEPFAGDLKVLRGKKVGRLRKARVSPEFDEARQRGVFVDEERGSVDLLVRAVAFKRLDYIAMDKRTLIDSAKRQKLLDEIVFFEPALGSIPVYLALSKERTSIDTLKAVSEYLAQSGEMVK